MQSSTNAMLSEQEINVCCAISYSHPLARWLLGDSFHPGGLALTARLGQALGVGAESHVLDIGSGRGVSAVHLAQTFGCKVTGITLESDGIEAGDRLAAQRGVEDRVSFVEGDFLNTSLAPESFDAIIAECVLSILVQKRAAVERIGRLLKHGGRFGLTDVTIDGEMPEDLNEVLTAVSCVGNALPLDGYVSLIREAGLDLISSQDLHEIAGGFLRDIKGKLMVGEIAVALGKVALDRTFLAEVKRLVALTQGLAAQGRLSYGMVVVQKAP